MTQGTSETRVMSGPMEIAWHPASRIASIRYAPDTILTRKEGAVLIETLTGWIGADRKPFAVLADAKGVRGADAEYRANTTKFFRQHREELYIALFNIGPLIRILADMFRLGSGLQVRVFPNEMEARAWLREKGIAG